MKRNGNQLLWLLLIGFFAACQPATKEEEAPKRPNIIFMMSDDHAYQAIEAARLGMGVALADPVEIREDLKSGRLMKIIEPACGVGQSVFVVCDEEDKQPLRTQLLIKAIKHWVNDSYEPVVQPKT